jgi:hypothetical protein
MYKSAVILAASSLFLLSACDTASRDPGYVCMHDCAHYCEDGIKGDECRRNIQMQQARQGVQPTDNGEHYYPDGDHAYYYGAVPGGRVIYTPQTIDTYSDSYGTTTTTTTTVTTPY